MKLLYKKFREVTGNNDLHSFHPHICLGPTLTYLSYSVLELRLASGLATLKKDVYRSSIIVCSSDYLWCIYIFSYFPYLLCYVPPIISSTVDYIAAFCFMSYVLSGKEGIISKTNINLPSPKSLPILG